jgi:endoglucanase
MAMAARVFDEVDSSYAKNCLAAAQRAWSYLEKTPGDGVGFQNPDSVSTGAYDDPDDTDERYWALAELYKTTGDDIYLSSLKKYAAKDIDCDLSWRDVGGYGMYAYLTSKTEKDAYYHAVQSYFFAKAEEAVEAAESDAYGAAIGLDGYYWGSNMGVADKGMLLLMANQLEPNENYVTAAARQLDYLLGTNTTSYCFVTGFGTLSPQHPHHRPSQVAGTPVSGMLVGGPDSNLDDSYAQATLSGKPAAACYADDEQSYSCNEITIYWNSPLVYLLTGIGG